LQGQSKFHADAREEFGVVDRRDVVRLGFPLVPEVAIDGVQNSDRNAHHSDRNARNGAVPWAEKAYEDETLAGPQSANFVTRSVTYCSLSPAAAACPTYRGLA
jgi:hypothetical protein